MDPESDKDGVAGMLFVVLLIAAGALAALVALGGSVPWFGKLPFDLLVPLTDRLLDLPLGTAFFISVMLVGIASALSYFTKN